MSSENGRKLASTVEPLLDVKQVAELLNISTKSVQEYARQRIIPSIKFGHCRRFRREAIDRFIERHTTDEAGSNDAETK